jgi:hypothetical protein
LHIIDLPTLLAQFGGKMAHGGKDQSQLFDMMRNIAGLAHHLGHQDDIARLVARRQRGDSGAKLISEDQDKLRGHEVCLRMKGRAIMPVPMGRRPICQQPKNPTAGARA